MEKLIYILVTAVIGCIATIVIRKRIIKINIVTSKMNEIREIFINDLIKIENLEPHENVKVGNIVIDNINETEVLMQKLFSDLSKSKVKKIKKHFGEYRDPYKSSHNAIVMLKGLREDSGNPDNKSFLYTNYKIPNARKIAIKHLRILIKDFE